jgi:hypothetical protein
MHTENIDNLSQQVDNPAEFWKLASKWPNSTAGFNYPESLGTINTSITKNMQGLISESQAKSYFVREQIIDLLKAYKTSNTSELFYKVFKSLLS